MDERKIEWSIKQTAAASFMSQDYFYIIFIHKEREGHTHTRRAPFYMCVVSTLDTNSLKSLISVKKKPQTRVVY